MKVIITGATGYVGEFRNNGGSRKIVATIYE